MPEEFRPKVPHLPDWLAFVWRAWKRLQRDRPWHSDGSGRLLPGRIPWRDVMAWADRQHLSAEHAEFLDYGIGILEAAYMEWFEMNAKRQAEGARSAGAHHHGA